jgi:hypothetical protein
LLDCACLFDSLLKNRPSHIRIDNMCIICG